MEALAGAITDEFDPALDDTVLRAITAEVDASLDDTVILPEDDSDNPPWSLTVEPHLSRHRLHPESPMEEKLALLQQQNQQAYIFFQVLNHRTPEGTMFICVCS